MRFIFIPFASDENNDELLLMASNWRYAYEKANKNVLKPRIICHKEKFPFVNSPVIYLIAHSTDDPRYVANYGDFSEEGCRMLDIRAAVMRLLEAGVNVLSNPKIKLYICGTEKCAIKRIEHVVNFLFVYSSNFCLSKIQLDVYKATVSVPRVEGNIVRRNAFKIEEKEDGVIKATQLGKVSQYRTRFHFNNMNVGFSTGEKILFTALRALFFNKKKLIESKQVGASMQYKYLDSMPKLPMKR